MNIYRTTTGVRVGILYRTPMPTLDADAITLQSALLEKRTRAPRPALMALLGRIYKWL